LWSCSLRGRRRARVLDIPPRHFLADFKDSAHFEAPPTGTGIRFASDASKPTGRGPSRGSAHIDTDETYRRDIKGIRNLQEGRHARARKICHGKKGKLYHRYERGLENQLGALGLVPNCVVLWTTIYLDAAVRQLKAQR
jgi:hypothetical protein